MVNLELGGLSIPVEAGGRSVSQEYSSRDAGSILSLSDGRIFKQTLQGSLGKLRTRISGTDIWAAAALANLNYDQPLLLKCVAYRSVMEMDNEIVISSKRRKDTGSDPFGFGIVNDKMIPTSVTMVGDNAELALVAGADRYVVSYWPQISVYANLLEQSDLRASKFAWTLECEEI